MEGKIATKNNGNLRRAFGKPDVSGRAGCNLHSRPSATLTCPSFPAKLTHSPMNPGWRLKYHRKHLLTKAARWTCAFVLAATATHANADSFVDLIPKLFPPPNSGAGQGQIGAHLHGAPLPAKGSPDERDFRKIYTSWLDRTILAHYPAAGDPAGAAFVRDALDYLGSNSSYAAPPPLLARERSFSLRLITDPALALMIGIIEPDSDRKRSALIEALNLIERSNYPKFIWFTAAANIGKAEADFGLPADRIRIDDETALKFLAQGLNDDSFLPTEMSALRWRFDTAGSFTDLFSREGQQVADIFQSSSKVPSWLKEYVEGYYFKEEAWKARGTNWANQVSQQGWQGFGQDLLFARQHLVESWKENPHDPAAAALMITVCMGENEEKETMRTWFDRSVAADFDYLPAYSKMRWGLRPRWLGNYAEMNAFGQECAATGRYDTCVPDERVAVAEDIAEDSQDHGAQFEDPLIASRVLDVIDTYFAQPKPDIAVKYSHTFAAIIAHKAGRMDEVKRHLAAIDYMPVSNSLFSDMDDLPALVNMVRPMSLGERMQDPRFVVWFVIVPILVTLAVLRFAFSLGATPKTVIHPPRLPPR